MLIAFTVMWADLKSSGNETCPSCVTITQCQCLSWTSPRFALIWQNHCKINIRGQGECGRDGGDEVSVRSGWPASHLPDPSDTSQLCVCLRDSAHASSSLRRRRPVSRAVAAQCGDWLPYTTPLATLGQADNFTLRHPNQKTAKYHIN